MISFEAMADELVKISMPWSEMSLASRRGIIGALGGGAFGAVSGALLDKGNRKRGALLGASAGASLGGLSGALHGHYRRPIGERAVWSQAMDNAPESMRYARVGDRVAPGSLTHDEEQFEIASEAARRVSRSARHAKEIHNDGKNRVLRTGRHFVAEITPKNPDSSRGRYAPVLVHGTLDRGWTIEKILRESEALARQSPHHKDLW